MAVIFDQSGKDLRALRHPEKRERPINPVPRKPDWIRVKAPTSKAFGQTREIVRSIRGFNEWPCAVAERGGGMHRRQWSAGPETTICFWR